MCLSQYLNTYLCPRQKTPRPKSLPPCPVELCVTQTVVQQSSCHWPPITAHRDQPLLCVCADCLRRKWCCSKKEPLSQTWRGRFLCSHRAAEGAHHWQYSTSCRENWSRASSKARHPGLVFFWKYWGLSNILFSQFVSLVARKFPLVARKLPLVACFPQALLLLIKNQTKQTKKSQREYHVLHPMGYWHRTFHKAV